MAKTKKEMLTGTPLQTLQCSTGLLEKGKEVAVPAGEALVWANQKPPVFKIKKPALPAKAK